MYLPLTTYDKNEQKLYVELQFYDSSEYQNNYRSIAEKLAKDIKIPDGTVEVQLTLNKLNNTVSSIMTVEVINDIREFYDINALHEILLSMLSEIDNVENKEPNQL